MTIYFNKLHREVNEIVYALEAIFSSRVIDTVIKLHLSFNESELEK
jgi:hypothetical protein